MIFCYDCDFDRGYNCNRDVKTNEFTGVRIEYHNKDINNDGKCPHFEKKRGFWARLIG